MGCGLMHAQQAYELVPSRPVQTTLVILDHCKLSLSTKKPPQTLRYLFRKSLITCKVCSPGKGSLPTTCAVMGGKWLFTNALRYRHAFRFVDDGRDPMRCVLGNTATVSNPLRCSAENLTDKSDENPKNYPGQSTLGAAV